MAHFRSGPHSPPVNPIFGSAIAIMPPARIPDPRTSSFLNGSAGNAISFDPARKLSGSVTGLPRRRRSAWGVNKIASVPPYLLRSAFGHDGLWVFANRIFANWIFSNRILAHRRRHWRGWLLARQVGGASSAQHAQQSNSDAQHGDEPGRAQHSKERSRHHSYE